MPPILRTFFDDDEEKESLNLSVEERFGELMKFKGISLLQLRSIRIFILFIGLILSLPVMSQTSQNFSNINVDQLSDDQINNYPVIKPGAEFSVPKKAESRRLTASEIVGLTSGTASLGAIILGVLNLIK